jgi:hypothetical protein
MLRKQNFTALTIGVLNQATVRLCDTAGLQHIPLPKGLASCSRVW